MSQKTPHIVLLSVLVLTVACYRGAGGREEAGTDVDAPEEEMQAGESEMQREPEQDEQTQLDIMADETVEMDAGDDVASDDETQPDLPLPFGSCPSLGTTLSAGRNGGFMANGKPREFILLLPDGIDSGPGPWPIVFFWTWYGGSAEEAESFLSGLVGDPSFPFIGVVPVSLHLFPPAGLEWDILVWSPADNDDVALFDNILACADEAFGVDDDHIHSAGHSAGGIMTDLLSIARGDALASIVSYSGAYFSDPEQNIYPYVTWPAYTLTNRFTALIAWGGTSDTLPLLIDFNVTSLKTITYLTGLGHDVIACNHGQGHTIPSDLSGPQLVEFFRDHPMGSHPTPYSAGGLPADFPAYCEIHPGP
jgi:poly(3-hydroxybutyrate) depolymerase